MFRIKLQVTDYRTSVRITLTVEGFLDD